jgi:16S rRNA (cytosine1402-N4)-methyltransferase
VPVLLREVLEVLGPKTDGRYVDGTAGGGGHGYAILKASAPDGVLFACDRDEWSVEAATKRWAEFAGRFEIRHGHYADLASWVGTGTCDGALLDLGISSVQVDRAERGFSFNQDGPLDMRMDRSQGRTAAEVVNEAPEEALAEWFWQLGEERHARRLAHAIAQTRKLRRFETTGQLAELVANECPRHGQRIHPATRVFQALRMVVNDELGGLRAGLAACWQLLKPEGRLAIITFHSLEDRMVKEFGRRLERDYETPEGIDRPELRKPKRPEARWISRKAIQPTDEEVRTNPRARSAQLRALQKL